MNIKSIIYKHVTQALIRKEIIIPHDLMIFRVSDKKKWDYQVNGIIKIAKNLNENPYAISQYIAFYINSYKHNIYKKIEVSKPGFINIFVNTYWIEKKSRKSNKIFSIRN